MLHNFSAQEISYLATTFAVTVSKGLDHKSIRVLISFFTSVVATLNLICNQDDCREEFYGKGCGGFPFIGIPTNGKPQNPEKVSELHKDKI